MTAPLGYPPVAPRWNLERERDYGALAFHSIVATRRPGRCLSEIEFRRFNQHDSRRWRANMRCDAVANGSHAISELYALRQGRTIAQKPGRLGFVSLSGT